LKKNHQLKGWGAGGERGERKGSPPPVTPLKVGKPGRLLNRRGGQMETRNRSDRKKRAWVVFAGETGLSNEKAEWAKEWGGSQNHKTTRN